MLLPLVTITVAALCLIISSNALSLDSSVHLARHQHIAARHPAAKRASVSARCKKRNSTSTAVVSSTQLATSTALHAPSPSQAPPPSSSPSSGSGKVGLSWSYGDDPALKNFITDKVSAFVDSFLFFSSSPYIFSPAYTLGPLLNRQTLTDCNMLQCFGAPANSLNSRPLSSPVMQISFYRTTSESMAPFFFNRK